MPCFFLLVMELADPHQLPPSVHQRPPHSVLGGGLLGALLCTAAIASGHPHSGGEWAVWVVSGHTDVGCESAWGQ